MIEAKYYFPFYLHLLLFITLLLALLVKNYGGVQRSKVARISKVAAFSLMAFTVFYIGYRPTVGGYFGDTGVYAAAFQKLKFGFGVTFNKDIVFYVYMKLCAQVFDVHQFFTICAFLYVVPLYVACRRWFGVYHLLAFVMLLGAFSFWTYGTNGVRNGIATSLVILGMVCSDRKWLMSSLFAIAIGFHLSVLLPILAFLLTFIKNNSKYYLWGWLLCIGLSLAVPGVWEQLFSGLDLGGDERLAGYLLNNSYDDQFSSVGFRWDFLAYSAVPVYLGYRYIYKHGFKEKLYLQIFNTYLVANGYWILIIQSSFSNRFAYLSWFLMPIVIIYPLLRKKIWTNQFIKIGWVIVLHFSFTYVMLYLIN